MKHEPTAQRLHAHDPDAWALLYRSNVEAVWRFAYRRLGGDRDAADEATSETFLAAVESIGRYDPAAGVAEGWLFGIARRKVADRLRALYRRRRRLVGAAPGELLQAPASPSESESDRAAARDRVSAVLASLPALHRDALVWSYQDGLTVAQMAQRLTRTEKAAENLLYRARQRFKDAYRAATRADERGERTHEQRPFARSDR